MFMNNPQFPLNVVKKVKTQFSLVNCHKVIFFFFFFLVSLEIKWGFEILFKLLIEEEFCPFFTGLRYFSFNSILN